MGIHTGFSNDAAMALKELEKLTSGLPVLGLNSGGPGGINNLSIGPPPSTPGLTTAELGNVGSFVGGDKSFGQFIDDTTIAQALEPPLRGVEGLLSKILGPAEGAGSIEAAAGTGKTLAGAEIGAPATTGAGVAATAKVAEGAAATEEAGGFLSILSKIAALFG